MDIEKKLQELLGLDCENEVVEFKEAKNDYHFDKLGKYFSALSNEANLKGKGCAWLVFGVKDNQTVVGSQYRSDPKNLLSLNKEIADKTTNRISFKNLHEVNHLDGRVVLLEIPAAPKGMPIAWNGHYYGRDGESLGALNMAEIEQIRSQNQNHDWSVELCVGATITDLDPVAIAVARKEFETKNPKLSDEIVEWDDKTFLNKAKITINGKITRAAILLLGKAESSHFLNPASPTISWILKDKDGFEKDYEHFSCPLLINAEEVFKKIRNLRYRYMAEGSLFPEEVDQYDPFIIREALNNAIAHQDYEQGGKITVIEFEDGRLCFNNNGQFIPGNVERVIKSDAPETRYRNRFLTDAMVNLNMIDTIGSGIKRMFSIQRDRFFPLPEFVLENDAVQLTVTGRVLDLNYARKLAQTPELSLDDIILLDKVQKRNLLSSEEVKYLKKQKLIEGRKPNFFISAKVAKHSSGKTEYIRNRGLDDQHYKKLICEYVQKFGVAKRSDINKLLLDKLPDVLTSEQKDNKIKNMLQSLKKEGFIEIKGKSWVMSK